MKHISLSLVITLFFSIVYPSVNGQPVDDRINAAKAQLTAMDKQRLSVIEQLENLKLERIRGKLKEIGLPTAMPGEQVIEHSAYILSYSEEHEQARWVTHMIIPDIIHGVVFRTNDFRPDPLVKTGSAVEEDYFLKKLKPDSTYLYDGFGYDRGHLAPSADFRWSAKALSESYYYSNMSPQLADFNRGSWGDR
ncbi:MAG TPA: DNA/RNA non-specific endonuclease, partial [Ferruginibacter sp.]|nr:DNA/RNA non-specific endonuclease [Ferruginibacter sp.]